MSFRTRAPRDEEWAIDRVVEAVAEQADTDPLELPPLYDAIDPEALNAATGAFESGELSFRYAGQFVTVHSDGTVDVSEESVCEGGQVENASGD